MGPAFACTPNMPAQKMALSPVLGKELLIEICFWEQPTHWRCAGEAGLVLGLAQGRMMTGGDENVKQALPGGIERGRHKGPYLASQTHWDFGTVGLRSMLTHSVQMSITF